MSHPATSSLPKLRNIDDVLALAIDCGTDITTLSQYLLPALIKLCNSHQGRRQEVLLQAAQGQRDPLTVIDAEEHSLVYLYILATRALASLEDAAACHALLPFIDAFVSHFQPVQIQLDNLKVHELALAVVSIATKVGLDTKWGLEASYALFSRYTSTIPGQLTTLHLSLVAYCIRMDQPGLAHEWVLRRPITDASRRYSPLKASDVIEYFYKGGCAYIQLRNWDRAESFFEQCITVPAHSAHDVQIAASKKLILVQLLRDGKSKSLPSYISPPVGRDLKRFTQGYAEFSDLYSARDRTITQLNLSEVISRHGSMYNTDGVMDLITELASRHKMRRIQRLGSSFTRLSIRDVISLLALQEEGEEINQTEERVTSLVEDLISTNQLQATLAPGPASPILTFTSTTPSSIEAKTFTSLEGIATLSKQMQLLQQWNTHIESKEREIACSKRFVTTQQSLFSSIGSRVGVPGGSVVWGGGMMLDDDFNEDVFA